MALHTFGPTIDVQAGGADLRFPHHAYQAALAETLTGVSPFARRQAAGRRGPDRRRENGQVSGQPGARP